MKTIITFIFLFFFITLHSIESTKSCLAEELKRSWNTCTALCTFLPPKLANLICHYLDVYDEWYQRIDTQFVNWKAWRPVKSLHAWIADEKLIIGATLNGPALEHCFWHTTLQMQVQIIVLEKDTIFVPLMRENGEQNYLIKKGHLLRHRHKPSKTEKSSRHIKRLQKLHGHVAILNSKELIHITSKLTPAEQVKYQAEEETVFEIISSENLHRLRKYRFQRWAPYYSLLSGITATATPDEYLAWNDFGIHKFSLGPPQSSSKYHKITQLGFYSQPKPSAEFIYTAHPGLIEPSGNLLLVAQEKNDAPCYIVRINTETLKPIWCHYELPELCYPYDAVINTKGGTRLIIIQPTDYQKKLIRSKGIPIYGLKISTFEYTSAHELPDLR